MADVSESLCGPCITGQHAKHIAGGPASTGGKAWKCICDVDHTAKRRQPPSVGPTL